MKKSLTKKLESLHQFLDSRLIWTDYVHDAMERFPPSIQLMTLCGDSALQIPGPGKRALQLGASVNLLPRGAVPPAVFQIIAALRNDPLMKQNFSKIELGNIGQTGTTPDGHVRAGFFISCQSTK